MQPGVAPTGYLPWYAHEDGHERDDRRSMTRRSSTAFIS